MEWVRPSSFSNLVLFWSPSRNGKIFFFIIRQNWIWEKIIFWNNFVGQWIFLWRGGPFFVVILKSSFSCFDEIEIKNKYLLAKYYFCLLLRKSCKNSNHWQTPSGRKISGRKEKRIMQSLVPTTSALARTHNFRAHAVHSLGLMSQLPLIGYFNYILLCLLSTQEWQFGGWWGVPPPFLFG